MSLELLKDRTNFSTNHIFYWLLFPTLILWWSYWRLSRRHLYELARRLPGPQGLPVVGHLFDFVGPASCKSPHQLTIRLSRNDYIRPRNVTMWKVINQCYFHISFSLSLCLSFSQRFLRRSSTRVPSFRNWSNCGLGRNWWSSSMTLKTLRYY